MNSISLDNPYLLLIAVPLIILFTVPFFIAVRKENRNGHNVASQILHVLMAIVIAFAAAGPTITTILTETNVYVVADVSYSANRNLDLIDTYISNLDLPKNAKLGLVCFGKNYELVSELGNPKDVKSVRTAKKVDDTQTNIAEALTYTGTLFDAGGINRIVLITDGKQTDTGDADAVNRAVNELRQGSKKIQVDAIFLDDNPSPDSKEVQISGVEFRKSVYLDSKQFATLEVQASYDTAATVLITKYGKGNTVESQEAVELTLGKNRVNIPLDTSVAGTFDYEVEIKVDSDDGDLNTKNNVYNFTQTVSDEMRILFITQSFDDVRSAASRYGEKGVIDIYEKDTRYSPGLKQITANQYANSKSVKIHMHDKDEDEFVVPYTLEELCTYDEIILADVDITTIENFSEFIENLDTVVSSFGKSLSTFGNLHIQNTDIEELDKLEEMLPVEFGNHDSRLYTILVDTSRSMFQLDHLNVAKEVIQSVIGTLDDDAYITIIKFNSDAEVIQPVTPLSERDEILAKVKNLEVRQGTVLGSGLGRAMEYIAPLKYDDKQVLLISDGISYTLEKDDPKTIVQQMYASGIVTSAFDVGRQGDKEGGGNTDDQANEAYLLLKQIAELGHGKHYYSWNREHLDDVTFGEMADDLTLSVIERETTVSVQRLQREDPVLEGIDLQAVPNVHGYVYGKSKPSATEVLTINHKRDANSVFTTEKPLYAYQNYGIGRVSTFMSAFGGAWVTDWRSGAGAVLFDNMFEQSVPEEKHSVPYTLNVVDEGKSTLLEVQPAVPQKDYAVKFEITLPDGSKLSEVKQLSGGSLYNFKFDRADVGKYEINVTYFKKSAEDENTPDGDVYSTYQAMYVCYIDEYDAFAEFDSSSLLRGLEDENCVHDPTDPDNPFEPSEFRLNLNNSNAEVGREINDFTVPLLIVAVVMFVVDIFIRKLKWDDIKSFFSRKKKKEVNKL